MGERISTSRRWLLWGSGAALLLLLAFTLFVVAGAPEKCQAPEAPFRLSFKLDRPTAQAGSRYPLWYRLGIKNLSCGEATAKLAALKFAGDYDHLSFRVQGPSGAIIPPDYAYPYDGSIVPYQVDAGAEPNLKEPIKPASEFFTIGPGTEVVSTPATYSPFVHSPGHSGPELWTGHTDPKYDEIKNAESRRRAERILREMEKQKPSPPPAGFRFIDDFVFTEPGKYKIQAIYSGEVFFSPPPQPFAGYPWPLNELAVDILRLFGRYEPRDGQWQKVNAVSDPLEFEVRP